MPGFPDRKFCRLPALSQKRLGTLEFLADHAKKSLMRRGETLRQLAQSMLIHDEARFQAISASRI